MPRTLKPIRWTVDQAASEFGLDRKTLAKRMKSTGVVPGKDSKFSTADICRAVFTDGEAARAALAVSQKEHYDLKNGKLSDRFADAELFQQISDGMVLILRQKISEAPIPEETKISILKEIQNIDVDEVVKENSKSNGSDLEDEPEAG